MACLAALILFQGADNILLAVSANESAEKVNSQEELSIAVSIAHANKLEQSGKRRESLAEFKMIYTLLAETDQRRVNVRQSILQIERGLAWEERIKKIQDEKGGSAPAPALTAAEEEKNKIENALAEISDLKELLQIAQTTHSELECHYWLGLAYAEIVVKDPKAATVYIHKFIETCPPEKKMRILYIYDPLSIAVSVSNQQSNNAGESIIRAYIESFEPSKSLSKQMNLYLQSNLLAYFICTGNYDEAKKYMPKLLQGSGLAIGDQWHQGSAFKRISFSGPNKLLPEQKISLIRQFIGLEKTELPIDAHILVTLLDQLADQEEKCGMNREAIRDYLEAERIEEKYTGLEEASTYEYRLKPILTKVGDLSTLKRVRQKCVKPPGYVNPQYSMEHVEKSINKNAPLAKKIAQAQTEYSLAKKQAIYSFRSEYALNNVVLYTEEAKQWKKAVEAHLQLCDYFEHSNQTDTQFVGAHFNYWDKRVKYYLSTVDACLKLNDRSKAIQIIHRAFNILPDLSCYEAAELGSAAIKCGDTQLAEQLATRAEEVVKKDKSWYASFEKLVALLKALKHEDRAAEVVRIQNEKSVDEDPRNRDKIENTDAEKTVTIPKDTKLPIVMKSDISSEALNKTEIFTATTSEDLNIDGQVAIPKGSKITGSVTMNTPLHRNRSGSMRMVFKSIQTQKGIEEPIEVRLVSRGGITTFARGMDKIKVDTPTQITCGPMRIAPAPSTPLPVKRVTESKPQLLFGLEPEEANRASILLMKKGKPINIKSGDETKVQFLQDLKFRLGSI